MQQGYFFIEGHFFYDQRRPLIRRKAAIHPGLPSLVFCTHLRGNRQQRKTEDGYAEGQ
jgi:hypothetical protein